jgi:predicted neuraminidase
LRTPLVIGFSADNGQSWRNSVVLEEEQGEYSYPAIVAQGQVLYITYTWKRERIAFWKISLQA